MRILVLNYEYPPLGGGGGAMSARTGRAYAAQNPQIAKIKTHAQIHPLVFFIFPPR